MKEYGYGYKGMSNKMPQRADYYASGKLKMSDNTQGSNVRKVNSNTEQYDLGRVKKYPCTSKGYPAEAWDYKY